jgi:hypothetical protein
MGEWGRYALRTSARYLSCMAMQSDVTLSRAIKMQAHNNAMFLN